jgi:hypothetical protein
VLAIKLIITIFYIRATYLPECPHHDDSGQMFLSTPKIDHMNKQHLENYIEKSTQSISTTYSKSPDDVVYLRAETEINNCTKHAQVWEMQLWTSRKRMDLPGSTARGGWFE